MRAAILTAGALIASGSLTACTIDNPGPMWAQVKYSDYRQSDFFPDGRAMQPPPNGTVPQERPRGSRAYLTGMTKEGKPVESFPLTVDEDLLLRGRHEFDIFCANCHGRRGDGNSPVARAMPLRKPPPIAAMTHAPGHVFRIISEGYGFMPSFGPYLTVRDRWGVVAYLKALHESQNAPLTAAPSEVRAMLLKERR